MQRDFSTPWEDASEVAMVKDWFFPGQASKDPYEGADSQDMRQEAVHRVNVWTFKAHTIPHPILATRDLTDTLLHYEKMSREADTESYTGVQYMLAFAFLRFVNGFVDRDATKSTKSGLIVSDDDEIRDRSRGAGETSMYANAAAIAMPSRFVDLRHRVSHGAVPDIESLRKAAEEGLLWLYQKWWKSNVSGDPTIARLRFESRFLHQTKN